MPEKRENTSDHIFIYCLNTTKPLEGYNRRDFDESMVEGRLKNYEFEEFMKKIDALNAIIGKQRSRISSIFNVIFLAVLCVFGWKFYELFQEQNSADGLNKDMLKIAIVMICVQIIALVSYYAHCSSSQGKKQFDDILTHENETRSHNRGLHWFSAPKYIACYLKYNGRFCRVVHGPDAKKDSQTIQIRAAQESEINGSDREDYDEELTGGRLSNAEFEEFHAKLCTDLALCLDKILKTVIITMALMFVTLDLMFFFNLVLEPKEKAMHILYLATTCAFPLLMVYLFWLMIRFFMIIFREIPAVIDEENKNRSHQRGLHWYLDPQRTLICDLKYEETVQQIEVSDVERSSQGILMLERPFLIPQVPQRP